MLAVAYAWITTGLRPFTLPALVATLAGGVVVILAGGRLSAPLASRVPVRGAWVWPALGGGVAVWELQAFLQHPRSAHPTISSLTNNLMHNHVSRAGVMLVWLAVGIWLARR
ncbi:MAG TPA: hypothetical protein VJS45_00120 [Acidimicrobiia bacterium]|nr:hypothetical protein [Acidimicrobiia bacterium]